MCDMSFYYIIFTKEKKMTHFFQTITKNKLLLQFEEIWVIKNIVYSRIATKSLFCRIYI